ncbi:MAG: ankyrin repeat domain-containing protein [Gammaproteobacteria bacterium]|nr:ankyrin repeat domain-containing protein [Gammaproteobacteria bacterium]
MLDLDSPLKLYQHILKEEFIRELQFLVDVGSDRAQAKADFTDKLLKVFTEKATEALSELPGGKWLVAGLEYAIDWYQAINKKAKQEQASLLGHTFELRHLQILLDTVAMEAARRYQFFILEYLNENPLEGVIPFAKTGVARMLAYVLKHKLNLEEEHLLHGLMKGYSGRGFTDFCNSELKLKIDDRKKGWVQKGKQTAGLKKYTAEGAYARGGLISTNGQLSKIGATNILDGTKEDPKYGYIHAPEHINASEKTTPQSKAELSPTLRERLDKYQPIWVTITRDDIKEYLASVIPAEKNNISLLMFMQEKRGHHIERLFFIGENPDDWDLSMFDFAWANLSDCVFNHCVFANSFEHTKFNRSYLRLADLTQVKNTQGCEFKEAHLEFVVTSGITITRGNFTQAYCDYGNFDRATLEDCQTLDSSWAYASTNDINIRSSAVESLAGILADIAALKTKQREQEIEIKRHTKELNGLTQRVVQHDEDLLAHERVLSQVVLYIEQSTYQHVITHQQILMLAEQLQQLKNFINAHVPKIEQIDYPKLIKLGYLYDIFLLYLEDLSLDELAQYDRTKLTTYFNDVINLTKQYHQIKKTPFALTHWLNRFIKIVKFIEFGDSDILDQLSTLLGIVTQSAPEALPDSMALFAEDKPDLSQWASVELALSNFKACKSEPTHEIKKLEINYLHQLRSETGFQPLFAQKLTALNRAIAHDHERFWAQLSGLIKDIRKLAAHGRPLIALQLLHTLYKDYLTKVRMKKIGALDAIQQSDLSSIIFREHAQLLQRWPMGEPLDTYQLDCQRYKELLHEGRAAINQNFTADKAIIEMDELQQRYTKFHQTFITMLLHDALDMLGGPPCSFAIIGFGSYARTEMLAFENLKYAVLVGNTDVDTPPVLIQKYFNSLNRFIKFKVMSLGEAQSKKPGFQLHPEVNPDKDPRLCGDPIYVADTIFDGKSYHYEDKKDRMLMFELPQARMIFGDTTLLVKFKERIQHHFEKAHLLLQLTSTLERESQENTGNHERQIRQHYIEPITQCIHAIATYFDIKSHQTSQMLAIMAENGILSSHFATWSQSLLRQLFILQLRLQNFYQANVDKATTASSLDHYMLSVEEKALLNLVDTILAPILRHSVTEFTNGNSWNDATDPGLQYCINIARELRQGSITTEEASTKLPTIVNYLMLVNADARLHITYYGIVPTTLRAHYLKLLRDHPAFKNQALWHELANIVGDNGIRASVDTALQDIDCNLAEITQTRPPESGDKFVEVTWITQDNTQQTAYLKEEAVAALITERNTLIKGYENSKHDVVDIAVKDCALHFKALPDAPMKDYSAFLLHYLLVGQGVPASTLGKFSVKDTTGKVLSQFPVLISQTIGSLTLDKVIHESPCYLGNLDHDYYTQQVLIALLMCPGDGAARNYVVSSFLNRLLLQCIDNETFFVEPIIRATFSNKIQFLSILFCLEQADQPLSPTALLEFCNTCDNEPMVLSLLTTWIKSIEAREKVYKDLFTEGERRRYYQGNQNEFFVSGFLIRPGVLGNLLLNIRFLKELIGNALSRSQDLTALQLLQEVHPHVGSAYNKAFRANTLEQRFKAATGAPSKTMTSSQATVASLGIIPSFEASENGAYTLNEAKKELSDLRPNFGKLVLADSVPDLHRQEVMLRHLANLPHTELDLSHCDALTDALLKHVLAKSNQLRVLDLRRCPKITDEAIYYLAANHAKTLEILYLSDNPGLKRVEKKTLFGSVIKLDFPNLKELHLSRCRNLVRFCVSTPQLMCEYIKCESAGVGFDHLGMETSKTIKPDKQVNTITFSKDDNSVWRSHAFHLVFGAYDRSPLGTFYYINHDPTTIFYPYPATVGCINKPDMTCRINTKEFGIRSSLTSQTGRFSAIHRLRGYRLAPFILVFLPLYRNIISREDNYQKYLRIFKSEISSLDTPPEFGFGIIGLYIDPKIYPTRPRVISCEQAVQDAKNSGASFYSECTQVAYTEDWLDESHVEGVVETVEAAYEYIVAHTGFWVKKQIPYVISPNLKERLLDDRLLQYQYSTPQPRPRENSINACIFTYYNISLNEITEALGFPFKTYSHIVGVEFDKYIEHTKQGRNIYNYWLLQEQGGSLEKINRSYYKDAKIILFIWNCRVNHQISNNCYSVIKRKYRLAHSDADKNTKMVLLVVGGAGFPINHKVTNLKQGILDLENIRPFDSILTFNQNFLPYEREYLRAKIWAIATDDLDKITALDAAYQNRTEKTHLTLVEDAIAVTLPPEKDAIKILLISEFANSFCWTARALGFIRDKESILIGIDYYLHEKNSEQGIKKYQYWLKAEQERYPPIISACYRNAQIILFTLSYMFDRENGPVDSGFSVVANHYHGDRHFFHDRKVVLLVTGNGISPNLDEVEQLRGQLSYILIFDWCYKPYEKEYLRTKLWAIAKDDLKAIESLDTKYLERKKKEYKALVKFIKSFSKHDWDVIEMLEELKDTNYCRLVKIIVENTDGTTRNKKIFKRNCLILYYISVIEYNISVREAFLKYIDVSLPLYDELGLNIPYINDGLTGTHEDKSAIYRINRTGYLPALKWYLDHEEFSPQYCANPVRTSLDVQVGCIALGISCIYRHNDIVEFLCQKYNDLIEKELSLCLAAKSGYVDIVRILLNYKVEINKLVSSYGHYGYNALHATAMSHEDSTEIVALILQSNPDINAYDNGRNYKLNGLIKDETKPLPTDESNSFARWDFELHYTALHLASFHGNLLFIKALIKHDPSIITIPTKQTSKCIKEYDELPGLSATYIAIIANRFEVAEYLLSLEGPREQKLPDDTIIDLNEFYHERKRLHDEKTTLAQQEAPEAAAIAALPVSGIFATDADATPNGDSAASAPDGVEAAAAPADDSENGFKRQ